MTLQRGEINLTQVYYKNEVADTSRPTFMRAFESSPVHCLNPRPSENRCRPENGGTIAILFTSSSVYCKITSNRNDKPVIYVIQNAFGLGFTMSKEKIFSHPGDEMVFECTFNGLMEKIWCNQLAYVSTRKIIRERLGKTLTKHRRNTESNSYYHIRNNTMLAP
jgi:hypothetical protein